MKLDFHKTEDGGHHVTARRFDGVIVRVPGSTESSWLPHTLGHYVIERLFGLHQGLWGCVAAGAIFPGMETVDGMFRPGALGRSAIVLEQARHRPGEAEEMVRALSQVAEKGLDSDRDATRAVLESAWQSPYRPLRLLKHEEVEEACRGLRQTRELWHPVKRGESLSLIW